MKPHPSSLNRALSALGGVPRSALMIGDSDADVHAAQAIHVRSVGYANKPGKAQALTDAGADGIVTTMFALADATARIPVP